MSKYKAIVTTAGAAKIAAASAGGKQLKITHMAVGDGNGELPVPNPEQVSLVNERYRAVLNSLTVDKSIDNHIVAEFIIPADKGGFWLREMGLFDESGTLVAVSNMAESYKPELPEGSGRTQTLRMVLIVSSTEAIQIVISGDTVLATRDFVEDAIKGHEKTRNHPDASTTAKGLVQLSSATTSNDETKASTPKAVKDVNDASAKKADNLSDLENKAEARGNLELGTAATKNVGTAAGNVMQVGAFGMGGGSNHKANAYNNVGEIYRVNNTSENAPTTGVAGVVSLPCDGGPSTAYVAVSNAGAAWVGSSNVPANGVKWHRVYTTGYKPSAGDVDAYSKSESDGRFAYKSITVNGKPLSSNVNLTAGDVNAWNKTESDGRYLKLIGGALTGSASAPAFIAQNNGLRIHSEQDTTAQLLFANAAGNVTKGRFYPEATNDGHRMVLHAGANASNNGSYWIFQPNGSVIMPNSVVLAANGGSQGSIEIINFGVGSRISIMQWNMATAGTWGMYLDHDSGRGIGFGVNGVIKAAGAMQSDGEMNAGGEISWNHGNCRAYGDGNIYGPIWGGYLRDWLVNNTISRVLRGAQGSMTMDGNLVEAPAGCVLTGGNGNEGNQVGIALYRPLQIWRSGYWQTIEG